MIVHLINPSHLSFGVGVITPRWLFVLAGATPAAYGPPRITDETLEPFDVHTVQPGDVVGIGIHTGNALRGYEIGTLVRERGATVIYGGIHATLYPGEAQSLGGAHAVVKGDGDVVWPLVLNDAVHGTIQPIYEAGRVDADHFVAARWELLPDGALHVGLRPDRARLPQAYSASVIATTSKPAGWCSCRMAEKRSAIAAPSRAASTSRRSTLYRQMYANTGIATDSARVSRANRWARLIARPCRRLFVARPLPALARDGSVYSGTGGTAP
jgi:hypothetical protein